MSIGHLCVLFGEVKSDLILILSTICLMLANANIVVLLYLESLILHCYVFAHLLSSVQVTLGVFFFYFNEFYACVI